MNTPLVTMYNYSICIKQHCGTCIICHSLFHMQANKLLLFFHWNKLDTSTMICKAYPFNIIQWCLLFLAKWFYLNMVSSLQIYWQGCRTTSRATLLSFAFVSCLVTKTFSKKYYDSTIMNCNHHNMHFELNEKNKVKGLHNSHIKLTCMPNSSSG